MSVYAALLRRRGAVSIAFACAIGWLEFASLGLLVVLLVKSTSGSFSTAGLAVGAFSLAASALAPLRGRAVDRHGGGALVAFATLHASCLAVLLVSADSGLSAVVVVAAAAASGCTAPPLIATARVLWTRVAGEDLIRAAHAMTALLGDTALVVGPAAAGALAAAFGAGTALGILAVGPVIGALIVVRIGVVPVDDRAARARPDAVLRSAGMRTIASCGAILGLVLGALLIAASAVAARTGHAELAGLPLAAFATGSVATSFWAGGSARAGSPHARYVVGFAIFGCALLGCLVARTIGALSAILLLAGGGYGLLNVGTFELLDRLVPRERAVEALTWLTSAESFGIAVGGALGGAVTHGATVGALAVAALAAPAGASLAFLRRRTLIPPTGRSQPADVGHANSC